MALSIWRVYKPTAQGSTERGLVAALTEQEAILHVSPNGLRKGVKAEKLTLADLKQEAPKPVRRQAKRRKKSDTAPAPDV